MVEIEIIASGGCFEVADLEKMIDIPCIHFYVSVMKIERMKAEDLSQVLVLTRQLGYPCALDDFAARFAEMKGHPEYAIFVARTAAGKVIGYLQINREPHTLLAGPRAEVAGLVVDEHERGGGVGAALIAAAESWARERDLPLIRIRSNMKRSDAHRFYQKNGYEIAKSWHLFTKPV